MRSNSRIDLGKINRYYCQSVAPLAIMEVTEDPDDWGLCLAIVGLLSDGKLNLSVS